MDQTVSLAMSYKFSLPKQCQTFLAAAAVLVTTTTAALTQHVVVMVNGEPITAIDIEQRSKFIVLTTQKPAPRQEVIDELIDEKLKIKEGKRWGIDVPETDVENTYGSMAGRMRLSGPQL